MSWNRWSRGDYVTTDEAEAHLGRELNDRDCFHAAVKGIYLTYMPYASFAMSCCWDGLARGKLADGVHRCKRPGKQAAEMAGSNVTHADRLVLEREDEVAVKSWKAWNKGGTRRRGKAAGRGPRSSWRPQRPQRPQCPHRGPKADRGR
jgi:hypothetical protein